MLSIYTLKSASEASKYYQKGDYYTEAGIHEYSLWLGKGAAAFNLEGSVDFGVFKSLLEGHLPDGTMMVQTEKGQHHRPGYDLTFSAPKSVSILALVGENKEILEAHRQAIKEVLSKIEEKYGSCRVKENGRTELEKTKNFIVAAFEHSDSREGDPNLHTHLVLMNMTLKENGEWRAIYADELYDDKLLNGMEYRSILALKLLSLGYQLRMGEKGTFEIEAVSQSLIDYFSKRRAEILKWMEDNKVSGGEAAKRANFHTRPNKTHSDPEERKGSWINELIASGSSLRELEAIRNQAEINGPIQLPDPYLVALQSVEIAIAHLAQKKDLFSMKEIIKTAKLISILPSSSGDFLRAIEQKVQNKELLYLENNLLTTSYLKELETLCPNSMQEGKRQVNKIMSGWMAGMISHFKLNTETQREALKTLLSNEDHQILLSTNSTSMLNEVLKAFSDVFSHQHYYPRVLTQQSSTVQSLKKKLGETRIGTIEGFLMSCEIRAEKQKTPLFKFIQSLDQRLKAREGRDIWIIHGDISLNQVHRLQCFSKQFGARIIFTEMPYHLTPAIELLKENGIKTVSISKSKTHEETLKTKDALLININKLETQASLQEDTNHNSRLKMTVDKNVLYRRDSTLIALSTSDCIALNNQARESLKEQGILKDSSYKLTSLQLLNMTVAEKGQPQLYQIGDIIRFNSDIPNTPLKNGTYFKVKSVNLDLGSLTLVNDEGQSLSWQPVKEFLKKIEVFKIEKREVCVGDKLVCTRTLIHPKKETLSLFKNQQATILAIDNQNLTLLLQNGKIALLENSDIKQQHWDHGYAIALKNIDMTYLKKATLMLSSYKMDNKTIHDLQKFLHNSKESNLDIHVVCDDIQKLKTNIEQGGTQKEKSGLKNTIPYKREEALRFDQDIATQVIFHGLQTEYLMQRQFNPEFLPENLAKNQNESPILTPNLRLACDIIDKICLYHSERESVFKLKDLKLQAAYLGGAKVSLETIEEAVNLVMKSGWLVVVSKENSEELMVAAKHTILLERLCIKEIKSGQNQLTPLFTLDSPAIQNIAAHQKLTKGQKEAITLLFTTPDRMIAIQGIAGSGKTTALNEVNKLCKSISVNPLVLANTGKTKGRAKQASNMEAMTLATFLDKVEPLLISDNEKAKQLYGNNRLIILDEVSQVGTKDLFRFQKVVKQLGTHSSILGDFKQQGSISAGTGYHDALAYGINKAVMAENVRLTDLTAFKGMKHAYAGDIAGSLHALKDSIEEIPNKEEALNRLVKIYMAMNTADRKTTTIVTPLNRDRKSINNQIRTALIEKKELEGTSINTKVLLPNDSHEVSKKEISHYQLSDFIRFNTNNHREGVKTGDYALIVHVNKTHYRLTLRLESGKEFYWSPKNLQKSSDIQIYHQEDRDLMKNDSIIFKRNNESEGVFNGDQATILSIKEKEALVLLDNGNTIVLDFTKKEHQHLDYSYALTAYSIQGLECNILAYAEGAKSYLKKAQEIKVGDTIVLSAKDHPHSEPHHHENSKPVRVMGLKNIEKDNIQKIEFMLEDRDGNVYTLQRGLKTSLECFPPFEQRRENELPLSTSLQAFIVTITRGNWLHLIVPYIDDFQKTLKKHETTKSSVLSYQDPNWKKLDAGVKRLVENIKGISVKNSFGNVEKMAPASAKSSIKTPLKSNTTTIKIKSNSSSNKKHFIDQDAVIRRLEQDILGYASQWLGSPKQVTGREASWPGSLTVNLKGHKAGWWKRWSAGEGGKDLISLYSSIFGIEWYAALKELAESFGIEPESGINRTAKVPKSSEKNDIDKEEKKSIKNALTQYKKGIPIQGTLAEKYLRKVRGITGELPEDFRFSAKMKQLNTGQLTPTLMTPLRDKNNVITGIVRVFLSPDGNKFPKTYLDKNGEEQKSTTKANLGLSRDAAVFVQIGTLPGTLWIAEGIETALSVAKAVPNQTVVASVSISKLKSVPVSPEIQKVIICADNDAANPNHEKTVIEAVESHMSNGKRVFLTIPPGSQKCDFNDLLLQGGMKAVKATLDQMVEITDPKLLKSNGLNLNDSLQKIRHESDLEIHTKSVNKSSISSKQPSSLEKEY